MSGKVLDSENRAMNKERNILRNPSGESQNNNTKRDKLYNSNLYNNLQ